MLAWQGEEQRGKEREMGTERGSWSGGKKKKWVKRFNVLLKI